MWVSLHPSRVWVNSHPTRVWVNLTESDCVDVVVHMNHSGIESDNFLDVKEVREHLQITCLLMLYPVIRWESLYFGTCFFSECFSSAHRSGRRRIPAQLEEILAPIRRFSFPKE